MVESPGISALSPFAFRPEDSKLQALDQNKPRLGHSHQGRVADRPGHVVIPRGSEGQRAIGPAPEHCACVDL